MRRNDLIGPMLDLHAKLATLPPPPKCGYYLAADLSQALGRKPTHADATAMRLLGWVRCAREVNGKTARAWLPPN